MVGLWNFRTANCGYNQTQTTYMRHAFESFEQAVLKENQATGEAGFANYMERMRAIVRDERHLEKLGFK